MNPQQRTGELLPYLNGDMSDIREILNEIRNKLHSENTTTVCCWLWNDFLEHIQYVYLINICFFFSICYFVDGVMRD